MKILFITLYSYYSNNSGMMRNRALVRGLVDCGHRVDIVTTKTNKLQETIDIDDNGISAIYYAGDNKLYDYVTSQKSKPSKIKLWIESCLRKVYHKLYPFDYTMGIAKAIDVKLLDNKEYDIIISSSNPWSSHVAARNFIKQGLKYKKWIQYWGDPLSNNISNTTILPECILKRLERQLFKGADKVVFVSPLTYEYEKSIHNNFAKIMTWLPIPYTRKQYFKGNRYISYFGDYVSTTRNIMPFYEAAQDIDAEFIIAGNSDIRLESSKKIKVLNRCDISKYMKDSKILVVLLNKSGTQIPGKIYHNAGTNIKVLVICDGEMEDEIEKYFTKYERYVFCKNTIEDITKKLNYMLADKNAVKPIDEFDTENITQRFLEYV